MRSVLLPETQVLFITISELVVEVRRGRGVAWREGNGGGDGGSGGGTRSLPPLSVSSPGQGRASFT